ncbi:CUB and sushi domain-containing protein 3 [Cinnamomum micranthum f. kanehirae]|uniref:CUB and sushi domain-containing protein 3 n=1 Tax=Cinnamomum micranthum f. kanehirae TaxID=337451 RepID=A0A3S3NCQ0_9MAGN|nr:CUB and sushi domain-containing protein 3 [Cinnamomum micranthum f. kanehirae]
MSLKWVAGLSLAIFLLILPSTPTVTKATTKTVGGSQGWILGINYTDWALKNRPFYINDTLIFRYDPPSNTTVPHNVYLLTRAQFENCSFVGAKLVASVNQGGGSGFKFILRKRKKPYYFACGVHEGGHCSAGLMKFSVLPFAHPSMD